MNKGIFAIAVFMLVISMVGTFRDNGKRNISGLYILDGIVGAILLYFV